MQRAFVLFLMLALGLVFGAQITTSAPVEASTLAAIARADKLPPFQPRLGRSRPLVVVVAENYYTELTDYVVPYGILSASGAADVMALATQAGPIRMFPAPMKIEAQATTAAFDIQHPQGADYVIVPAVHRDDDATLVAWVAAQARKGAIVVGVCDGVWVLGHAGLLNGRKATGHWYSYEKLGKTFPQAHWVRQTRYVADGPVVTTTGVSATIPVSLALVEAIAGNAQAQALASRLGLAQGWSAQHPSERFALGLGNMLTVAGNFLAFWSHESVGVALSPGVDEIALALQAEVYSATFRSTAYTVATGIGPVKTLRGLSIIPDRVAGTEPLLRMLPPQDAHPLRALDSALQGIASDYGARTARWVATQMEYPGY